MPAKAASGTPQYASYCDPVPLIAGASFSAVMAIVSVAAALMVPSVTFSAALVCTTWPGAA